MSDKLAINNYLLILKSNVEVYIHGTLESSNDSVRKVMKKALDNTLDRQKNTFELMCSNDWYKVECVSKNEISKSLEKLG